MSRWRPLPSEDDDDPKPVSASLDRLASKLGAPKVAALGVVFSHWNDVVGDVVAAHAKPLSLQDGRLVVGVDEPGWATQLNYLTADLLRRLEELAGPGAVTAVEVRVRRF
jgi:predicted nucleic acid-binding Zn ribbon protein